MQEIHIIKPGFDFIKIHIVYDGKAVSRNRQEYPSLDELLKRLPDDLRNFNPKKIGVYLEGYSSEDESRIKSRLEHLFKKVVYFNGLEQDSQ